MLKNAFQIIKCQRSGKINTNSINKDGCFKVFRLTWMIKAETVVNLLDYWIIQNP